MGLNIPLTGVSTLDALANKALYASYQVCPVIPSHREEVSAALYIAASGKMKITKKPLTINIEDLLDTLKKPTLFIGEGAVKYKSIIKKRLGKSALFAPMPLNFIRGSDVAFMSAGKTVKTSELSYLNLKVQYLSSPVKMKRNPK